MNEYNTLRNKLQLPEYGRNIQQMVEYCMTLEDRQERTQCAYSIISAMETINPSVRQEPNYKQKLWDHLAIISDFKLDIDYPVPTVESEELHTLPEPIYYERENIRRRHYGKLVERMAEVVSHMEDNEERRELVLLLANHMKKLMLAVNTEGVEDDKIFLDLMEMTHGAIRLEPSEAQLHYFENAPAPAATKSKKKRKK